MNDPPPARRRSNEDRVLALLTQAGQASRGELARELRLPKATVADLAARLISQGLIAPVLEPAGSVRAGRGRPGQVLALTGPAPAIAVITWTSGQLRCSMATLSGQVRAEDVLVPELSPADAGAPPTEVAVTGLRRVCAEAGYEIPALAAVVLSVPAPFQRGVGSAVTVPAPGGGETGRRRAAWAGEELADTLTRQAGTSVLVENDANLGALGEHAFGAGRGEPDQVFVKFGQTSVGAGLIIGDRLHRGARGFAGELAHVQVRENGPVCACGGRGCLIRTISTEMIDLAQPAYEPRLTYPAMIGLAESGDVGMQRLLGDFGRAIGRPLADLCTLLNPGLFVLDGSIGQAGEHVIAGMREVIDRHACPVMSAAAQVVPGSLGSRAEVLGAVVLARLSRPAA
ncbi:MAG TPA: ROK family transcriptional regulator [Streptosporangiaceae bacterium]|nr:ROK family transcriptional regulator [Streptosporangiaceae bacterium]